MTKKDRAELQSILAKLKQAQAYIMDGRTAIARRGGPATTTLHFTRADGEVLYPVNKEIGSDIVGLHHGIYLLDRFLDPRRSVP
jgi:hypothetical protein